MAIVQCQMGRAQDRLLVDGGFAGNLHSTAMSDLFFDSALLPTGWAHDVRIGVDSGGWISAVEADTTPRGARHVPGIALPGDPGGLARYVAELAAVGVSALAVELGSRYVHSLPAALVTAVLETSRHCRRGKRPNDSRAASLMSSVNAR